MFKSLVATLLSSLALLSGASALAQTDTATAELLMRESGLWKQLEAIAPQTRAGLASTLVQINPSASPTEVERVAGLADDAFTAARLRSVAQSVIARRTNQGDVAALLAWYRSPTGKSLTKHEEDASADARDPNAAMAQDSAFFASLPAARQALVKQLVQVSRGGESLTTITINTAVAVQAGLASAMPNAPAVSAADMRAALEQQRPKMLSALSSVAAASYARTYANVPDADLSKYLAFLESSAGARFIEVALQALDAALVEGATELGRSIPQAKGRSRI